MDLANKIKKLEQNLKSAEEAKIRAEVELKEAESRKAEIEKEMEELGVNPETVEAQIKELEEMILKGVEELEGYFND